MALRSNAKRRLETRLLVKNNGGVYGVTYRWGGSLTNAALVPDAGLDEAFTIDDGGGILRTQIWHYPSRTECLVCHSAPAGYALGFNTSQMNRGFDYGSGLTNQIGALSLAGYFSAKVTGLHTLPALAAATNSAVSLEYRVRSYLAANCVQCHQPGGSAFAAWDARLSTATPQAGIINGPLVATSGVTNRFVVAPGSLSNSVMFTRLANLGPDHMPPLATSLVNTQALALLGAWITNDLPSYQTFPDWQLAHFGSTNAPNAAPTADPDGDRANNYLEYVTGTDPLDPASYWQISVQSTSNSIQILYPQLANRGFEVQAASNLSPPAPWVPLDLPGNEPFFSVSNRAGVLSDPAAGLTNRFYRVRVFTP